MQQLLQSYLDSQAYRLSSTTVSRFRHNVNRWYKVCSNGGDADTFRRALFGKLSNTTIEDTISDIAFLHRWHGLPFVIGARLRRSLSIPQPPTITDIDKFVSMLGMTTWPLRRDRISWWKTLVLVACWTGFRLKDISQISPRNITSTAIVRVARKTGKRHVIPSHPSIVEQVANVDPIDDTLLAMTKSRRQLYREFKRVCDLAGIPQFRPKQLRQFSINQWSAANADAGRIIHGCGLGVMRHYLNPTTVLEMAKDNVAMPGIFTSARNDEQRLIELFKMAKPNQKSLVIQMLKSFGE